MSLKILSLTLDEKNFTVVKNFETGSIKIVHSELSNYVEILGIAEKFFDRVHKTCKVLKKWNTPEREKIKKEIESLLARNYGLNVKICKKLDKSLSYVTQSIKRPSKRTSLEKLQKILSTAKIIIKEEIEK